MVNLSFLEDIKIGRIGVITCEFTYSQLPVNKSHNHEVAESWYQKKDILLLPCLNLIA